MGTIVILPAAALLALLFQKKIEETIVLAMLSCIAILYVSGLFLTFVPGFYLVIVLCVIAIPITAFLIIKKPTVITDFLLTSGLTACFAFGIVFYAFNHSRHLICGVDFLHWGIAVRDFFQLSDFSFSVSATDLFPAAPPATTIWNWFSVKLQGRFSESTCFTAQEMLQIALVLPLFSRVSRRDWKKGLILFTVLLALPLICSDEYAYQTLAPVFITGYAAGYLFLTILRLQETGNSFYLIALGAGCFFLGLNGYTGMITAVIFSMIVCIGYRKIAIFAASVLPVVVSITSWRFFCNSSHHLRNSAIDRMLSTLAPVSGAKSTRRILTLVIDGFSSREYGGTVGHLLPFSVLSLFLMLAVLLFAFRYLSARKGKPVFCSSHLLAALFTGGSCYLLSVFFIYRGVIPAARADELAYLPFLLIPLSTFLLLGTFILLLQTYGETQSAGSIFWMCSLWVTLLSFNAGSLLMRLWDQPAVTDNPAFSIALERGFDFHNARIFYLNRPEETDFSSIRTFIEKSETEIGAVYYHLSEEYGIELNLAGQDLKQWRDNARFDMDLEAADDMIENGGYNYVYISPGETYLNSKYLRLFPDEDTLKDGVLYQVNVYGGIVQLPAIVSKGDL